MDGLAIGRIVHVRVCGRVQPAIVVNVLDKDEGLIRAHVFSDPLEDPPGNPIDPETGMEFASKLRYDDGDEPALGTWHWPPRA